MPQDTDTLDPTPSRSLSRSSRLTFSIDRRDHEARLAVVGELDLATQESMSQAAAAILHPPVRAVLLDLGGVSFFGATGVTTLINLKRDAAKAGIRLVLTGVSPTVRRVLDLTGTTDLIPIAYTRTVARTTADSLNTDAAEQNWLPTNALTCYPGLAPAA
jgi:anti-anti-sigma factor